MFYLCEHQNYTTMKRLIWALALLVSSSASGQALFSLGLTGGAATAWQNFEYVGQPEPTVSSKAKLAYNLGGYAELYLPKTPFSFRSSLAYRTKGSNREVEQNFAGTTTKYTQDISLGYMTADLVAKLHILNEGIRPYVGVGIRADANISSDYEVRDFNGGNDAIRRGIEEGAKNSARDLEDKIRGGNFSAIAVAGVKISRFYVEVEYNTDLRPSYENVVNGVGFKARNNTIGINVGVAILQF